MLGEYPLYRWSTTPGPDVSQNLSTVSLYQNPDNRRVRRRSGPISYWRWSAISGLNQGQIRARLLTHKKKWVKKLASSLVSQILQSKPAWGSWGSSEGMQAEGFEPLCLEVFCAHDQFAKPPPIQSNHLCSKCTCSFSVSIQVIRNSLRKTNPLINTHTHKAHTYAHAHTQSFDLLSEIDWLVVVLHSLCVWQLCLNPGKQCRQHGSIEPCLTLACFKYKPPGMMPACPASAYANCWIPANYLWWASWPNSQNNVYCQRRASWCRSSGHAGLTERVGRGR